MDMSQHSTHHETVHLIAHLDELERKLFAVGQTSHRNFKVYKLYNIFQNNIYNHKFKIFRNGFEENRVN